MIKRRHGMSLSPQSYEDEDVNPNAYVVNVADCMLVLVLGMLVALVSHYGVDLTQQNTRENEEIIGIEVNMDENDDGEIDGSYEPQGTVYYDAETDSYYFVADNG